MTLTFEDAHIQSDNGVWLCLKVNESAQARKFVMEKQSRLYDLEIKQHRDKRSLEANRYMWALLDELASALHMTKKDLYIQKVREVGVFKDFHLTEDEAKTFRVAWEKLGDGWPTEQVDFTPDGERLVIRAYYGSSTYNTKQMSRLLDSVVEECKAQDIETLSERELSLMKEEWGNAPTN